MSKKILVIDPEEALRQFPPAICGQSDLNENQAERLATKLVTLLKQNCRVEGVIEFEAVAEAEKTGIQKQGNGKMKKIDRKYSTIRVDKYGRLFLNDKEIHIQYFAEEDSKEKDNEKDRT